MNKVLTFIIYYILQMSHNDAWNMFNTNDSIEPMEEENIFGDINDHLQDITNNIFTSLNLDRLYIGQYETRLLLSMHASLKKISEKNYHLYKDVTNASRLDPIFHEFKNTSLFKLDKPIDEIMAKDFSLKVNNTRNINNTQLDSIELPDESEETYIFLRDYLNNVENIELQDIAKPSKRIKEMLDKHKKFREAQRRNFKAWKPLNFQVSKEWNARRVFNGNQVKIKKFPFVASIHMKNKFVCTGAVINRNLIISAASCFHEVHYNPKFLQDHPHAILVRIGSEYPDRFGDSIEATNVFIHPNYEAATLRDNIAIVQIKKHIHLKKKNRKIKRVEFQKMKGGLPNSVHEVLILGWGDKEDENGHLSYSHLKLYKLKDCMNIYSKYVTEKNFCAGFSGKGAGACQRDAGGPAIVSNVLVGVVSFGPPVCGSPHAPTVFTNIGHHVSWIESIIERTQGRSTTVNPSNYMAQPPVSEFNLRQYSQLPQQTPPQNSYTISNPRLQYPEESLNVLSNVLRDIMSHGERMYNENRLGMRPNGVLWNTTTVTSITMAHGSVSSPNQIDRIIPFNFNNYARIRQNERTQITSPTNQGSPFNKMSMKPLNFYTKYNNLSIVAKPENILRYATEASNKKSAEEEESSSDSENYESSEEKGMGIEVPLTLAPTISHIEGRMALYEPQSMGRMPFPKFPTDFEIPPARQSQGNPVDMIKYFVKNKLAPVGSQVGIPENDFREKAEEFLIQNYVKERLFPMNQPNALRTVSSFKNPNKEEFGENFLGKKYKKHLEAEKSHVSDEFVLLLLKHTTVRKKRYRYQVAGNTRDNYIESYMRGLSSSFRTPKGLKRNKKNWPDSENKFIIEENRKTTRAYEQLLETYSQKKKITDGDKAFQKKLLIMKERNQLFQKRQAITKEKEFTASRFSLIPGKSYNKHTPFFGYSRFVTRLFRDIAKKRALSNGVVPIQAQNMWQNNINDYEKQLISTQEKYRSNLPKDPHSINTMGIDEKEKYDLSTPTVKSIFNDYENEKISSSSSENKYNDSTSSESKYNDSTSSESKYNDSLQVKTTTASATLRNKYSIDQNFDNDNLFMLNPYSTLKNYKYQDQTIINDSIYSINSTVRADYVNMEEPMKQRLEKYYFYPSKPDIMTIGDYEYENESISGVNENLHGTSSTPTSAVTFNMKDSKEQTFKGDNLYTLTTLTMKDYEYDSNLPSMFRADTRHLKVNLSNSNYYFSSPEDLLFYGDDNGQKSNSSNSRRSFVDKDVT